MRGRSRRDITFYRPMTTPMRLLLLSLIPLCSFAAEDPPRAVVVDIAAPRYLATTIKGITMQCVTFDSRSHFLKVLDQPDGPGTLWPDCQTAGQSVKGLAAINAGYFTPQGSPLGVVIASGRKAGSNNATSLGSAVWFESNGRSAIVRREKTSFKALQLIQAGPLLAENSKEMKGLDTLKNSARCFIAWDGGSNWMIVRSSPCSLAQLSHALAGSSPAGFPIHCALNLDGGRSAEIYVSQAIGGGPVFNRPIWNNPVRNFLVLQAR
jgi:hypothetical protein